MNSKLPHSWALPPTWVRFLVLSLLVLGVFFRFVNLDRKVYWFDETFTSLRISGYTELEAVREVCNGQTISVAALQKYQHPNSKKTLTDTVKSLAIEDPHHPPLYYTIARFWMLAFGSSVAVIRSLSAFISLLAFPCIYWLCLELFKSPLTGWVAIALLAVSPFHVLYAQEAREYGLWIVVILLSSATLLRAIRLKTNLSWGMYAATLILMLYTHLFSVLVAVSHGIYVVVTEGLRLSKTVSAYLLASIVGFIAFAPWIWVAITQSQQLRKSTDWTAVNAPISFLLKKWIVNLSYFFFDFQYALDHGSNNSLLQYLVISLILFILILVGYSLYFLYQNTTKQVWLFVLILIGVTALAFMVPDVILGGQRSKTARYLIPSYLGIQLAVAYLLSTQITPAAINTWQKKLWQFVTVALFSVGILSCATNTQVNTSWNKDRNYYTPELVRIINQSPQPLLISSCEEVLPLGNELPLSYLLNSQVQFLLVSDPNLPQIPNGFSDVFLLNSSPTLKQGLEKEQNYKIDAVYRPNELEQLWKLEKQ